MTAGDGQAVEPVPPTRGPGRIIVLNGASSSGKSTLAKALQLVLDEPFLHVSSDHLVAPGLLTERREEGGPFDWWHQMRPRFFAGFHRCLLLATSLSGDPAAGLCEDDSARLLEHPDHGM